MLDADAQYLYADSLFKDQKYRQAVDEYSRFRYFFPQDSRNEHAAYQIARSHFRLGDYRLSIKGFLDIVDRDDFSGPQFPYYLGVSNSYLALGHPGAAITHLNNLIALTKLQAEKDAARYELGWIHLEYGWAGTPDDRFDPLSVARNNFGKVSTAHRHNLKIPSLLASLDKTADLPEKSPVLAGALSIIPGAGQIYCNRYQDALSAFILNAALGIAAFESFDNELYALGGIISMVGAGFYIGNIYGAISGAHKYNRKVKRSFVYDLKAELKIDLSREKAVIFELHYPLSD